MGSVWSIVAAFAIALSATFGASAAAEPSTVEQGCSSLDGSSCKFTIPMAAGATEIRFVSCTVYAKEDTTIYRVVLTVSGARTHIPLVWQRLDERGPRELYTFNQQLLLVRRGTKSPEFLISGTGPFEADCTVSMV
jgi:hypothetical protein